VKDSTALVLGVAALVASLWLQTQNTALNQNLNQCRVEFEAFKEGIIYGK
jgi:hypothetical protein